MYFKQFYLGCLAHASYLIGSRGQAIVVDPQRDIEQYIAESAAHGLTITYVIETHLHADFVSGHRELAERTGATIVLGRLAHASFIHLAAADGDRLEIGDLRLYILETPGHSPESICILVEDTADRDLPIKLLSGDTLFIGDVGRPDLASARGHTAEEMAAALYDTLHQKILPLEDSIEIYPAHGAGSLCGRSISTELTSTLGRQKLFNYALQPMSKSQFVAMMTSNMPEAPAYFLRDAEINRNGAGPLADAAAVPALDPVAVQQHAASGAILLDVRAPAAFCESHIPDALHIGLSGQFAVWAGSLIDLSTPLVLVAENPAAVDEARIRLARVGIENVRGYLAGGMPAWTDAGFESASVPFISIDELSQQSRVQVFDVRRPSEVKGCLFPGAHNLPLGHLTAMLTAFDPSRPTAVICQGGYRSAIAAGILAREGFLQVFNVMGGMDVWNQMRARHTA